MRADGSDYVRPESCLLPHWNRRYRPRFILQYSLYRVGEVRRMEPVLRSLTLTCQRIQRLATVLCFSVAAIFVSASASSAQQTKYLVPETSLGPMQEWGVIYTAGMKCPGWILASNDVAWSSLQNFFPNPTSFSYQTNPDDLSFLETLRLTLAMSGFRFRWAMLNMAKMSSSDFCRYAQELWYKNPTLRTIAAPSY